METDPSTTEFIRDEEEYIERDYAVIQANLLNVMYYDTNSVDCFLYKDTSRLSVSGIDIILSRRQ